MAYWLKKYGYNPTIIESSPQLRQGGYVIDFFGSGYEVASKMGIIPYLEEKDLRIDEITFVDKNSRRVGGLNPVKIRKLMDNKAYNILRSDLANAIHTGV